MDWGGPLQLGVGCEARGLGGGDQESQNSVGGQKRDGFGEDRFEPLHGAEGHDVSFGRVRAGGDGVGPIDDYIDARECKCSGYFVEEGSLFVIRFDHGQADGRSPDFQRDRGESSAGADVEDANVLAQSERGRGTLRGWEGIGCRGFGWEEVAGQE